jgi:ferredoxin
MATQARGNIRINDDECKGCGLCVDSCPPKCLELLPELNAYGVHPAHYTGHDCTGCGRPGRQPCAGSVKATSPS